MSEALSVAVGEPLSWREILGLTPGRQVLDDVLYVARGPATMPRSRVGLSSLRLLRPRLALGTWLGRRRRDRRVPIYNFFNRVPSPPGEPYSARVTYARDFRGGRYTYDGHLGTDFAVPIGTPVV